jgi:hypothetical protein
MLFAGLPVGAFDTNHSMMVGESGSRIIGRIFPMNRHPHKVTVDRFLRFRSIHFIDFDQSPRSIPPKLLQNV